MTTISLSREKVISTVDFIVEQYEKAQVSRWEEIRSVISPSVGEYCHWRDCFLRDWERVRSKLQGISLLLDLSDSDDLIKYLKFSKEKVTDLWTQCGVELTELQHPEYKESIVGGNQVRALVSDLLGQGGTDIHSSDCICRDCCNRISLWSDDSGQAVINKSEWIQDLECRTLAREILGQGGNQ